MPDGTLPEGLRLAAGKSRSVHSTAMYGVRTAGSRDIHEATPLRDCVDLSRCQRAEPHLATDDDYESERGW